MDGPTESAITEAARRHPLVVGERPEPEPAGSPLHEALTIAEQSALRLHEVLSRLEERLDPVLAPVYDAAGPADGGSADVAEPSAVRGRVEQLTRSTDGAMVRVLNMLARLEV